MHRGIGRLIVARKSMLVGCLKAKPPNNPVYFVFYLMAAWPQIWPSAGEARKASNGVKP
jgi:hypothetical protein